MNSQKKLKVILFGTGKAFKNYIKRYKDEYEIIGITDWEYKNHGKEIEEILVVNPYKLDDYNFDKIVILSYYTKEIIGQLKEKINFPEEKIIIPFKYKLKHGNPFKHKETYFLAKETIFFLSSLMYQNKISLFLDYGTLLGFVRDGDIILWDDDVDFSINKKDEELFIEILKKNILKLPFSDKVSWHLSAKVACDNIQDIRALSLSFKNKEKSDFQEFDFGIRVRQEFDDLSVVMYSNYLACKAEHFKKAVPFIIDKHKVYLPYNYEGYLEHVYGSWKEPQQMTFATNQGTYDTTHLKELKVSVKDIVIF